MEEEVQTITAATQTAVAILQTTAVEETAAGTKEAEAAISAEAEVAITTIIMISTDSSTIEIIHSLLSENT